MKPDKFALRAVGLIFRLLDFGAPAGEGTPGQSLAGKPLSGNPFAVSSGFRNFTPLAPTALSGGRNRTARSTAFGYHRFENVPVGETYVLTVRSEQFVFLPDTRIVTVLDDLTGMDFTAQPEN